MRMGVTVRRKLVRVVFRNGPEHHLRGHAAQFLRTVPVQTEAGHEARGRHLPEVVVVDGPVLRPLADAEGVVEPDAAAPVGGVVAVVQHHFYSDLPQDIGLDGQFGRLVTLGLERGRLQIFVFQFVDPGLEGVEGFFGVLVLEGVRSEHGREELFRV